MTRAPERIVCLTEETTETLYLLGEERRIVGISGFTVRPKRARAEKPKVSAFTSAKIDRILALEPDLVLGFSDLQAPIADALVRLGLEVHIFNQRDVAGILRMIETLGALVGCPDRALHLIHDLESGLVRIQHASRAWPCHPRVYFEEWDDPLISGIGWVSELIEIAGGIDCFRSSARKVLAKDRIIADASLVIQANPDLILASWCGKKFRPERLCSRPGFERIRAVATGSVHEIPSSEILQPGPAALTDGVMKLHARIGQWVEHHA
ncbi:periplasmic binding protein [mine drainage metagenome]|uniref:Periplasmic binding protein n=2 Tax=mine drainage metagenome TaxID=410659 RepID=T1BFM6_9ZZZZ